MLKLIRNQFLLLLPILTITFNPTKDVFGGVISLLDIFTFFQLILFVIYLTFNSNPSYIISKYLIYLCILFVFLTISMVINESGDVNLIISKSKYLIRWFEYICIFTITFTYLYLDNLRFFKFGLYVACLLITLFAIIQVVFFEEIYPLIYWRTDEYEYVSTTIRAFSFLDNPLSLCAYLAFPLGFIHYEKNRIIKTILIILLYVTLVFTASKIALVLVIVSVFFLFKSNRLVIFSLSFFLISIFSYILFFDNELKQNLFLIERLTNPDSVNESSFQRIYVIGSSLQMIFDNLIFGIGNENFKKVYINERYIHPLASTANWSFTAENFFLDFYLDNGLIPFVIIVMIFINSFTLINHKNSDIKAIIISLLFYLIVAMIMSARTVALFYSLFTFFAIQLKLNYLTKNE